MSPVIRAGVNDNKGGEDEVPVCEVSRLIQGTTADFNICQKYRLRRTYFHYFVY